MFFLYFPSFYISSLSNADKMLELHSILNPYSYDGKKAVDIFNSICNDLRKNPPRVK